MGASFLAFSANGILASPPIVIAATPSTSSLALSPHVTCRIALDDAQIDRSARNAAERMERRGIRVDRKMLHQLRKKETQKATRKARKELQERESDAGCERFWEAAFRDRMTDTLAGIGEERSSSSREWPKAEDFDQPKKLMRPVLQGRDLDEFRKMLISRRKGDLDFFLKDDDLDEAKETGFCGQIISADKEEMHLNWLVNQLNAADIRMKKLHFSRLMHSGRLKLTEGRVLRLVQKLGDVGNWRCAMHVVNWVHDRERYQHCKSRFVYTTLLAVLGNSRRPTEALNVFNVMRESFFTYPDMAAYHSLAVTLGQAGKLIDLLYIVDVLRVGPKRRIKDVRLVKWNGRLLPDIIIYNAIINACVPHKQWEGTLWILEQINKEGLLPNSATYGLTIEVMVKAEKFDLARNFYQRMEKRGLHPNSHTYKALVEALGRAGKADVAVELIEGMEKRGIVASAAAYFSLACCLCSAGRWQDAIAQVEKMRPLSSMKSEVVTYTGLIKACKQAGLWNDAILLFNRMQLICAPNIGTLNLMIGIYGKNHSFEDAKCLYEGIKKGRFSSQYLYKHDVGLFPDEYTYEAMLGACALAERWDYFEQVYREMCLRGFQLDKARHSWLVNALSKSNKMHLVDIITSKWQFELENLEFNQVQLVP